MKYFLLLFFIVIFSSAQKFPKFTGTSKGDLLRYLATFCSKQLSESKLLLVIISNMSTLVSSKNHKILSQFTEQHFRSIGCHNFFSLVITNVTNFENTVNQKMKPYKYRTVQYLLEASLLPIFDNKQKQQEHLAIILKLFAKFQFNANNRCLPIIIYIKTKSQLNFLKKCWLLLLSSTNRNQQPYLRRFQAIIISSNDQVVYLKPVINGCQLYPGAFFTPSNSSARAMLNVLPESCNLHQAVLNVTVNNVINNNYVLKQNFKFFCLPGFSVLSTAGE